MALNYPRWRTEDLQALIGTLERRLVECASAGQAPVFYAGAVAAIELRDELRAVRAEIARRDRPGAPARRCGGYLVFLQDAPQEPRALPVAPDVPAPG